MGASNSIGMMMRWKSVSDWASFTSTSPKKVIWSVFCPLFCMPGKLLSPSHILWTTSRRIKCSFVEYTYGLSMMKPFPVTSYPNIEALALKVLQRFSRTMLCMPERGQRYGPSGKPRPVEAAYQDEFYRRFAEEVGPGVGIVSERSCVGQGRIDFTHDHPWLGIRTSTWWRPASGTLQKIRTTGNISPVHPTRPTHRLADIGL